MKPIYFFISIIIIGCNNNVPKSNNTTKIDTLEMVDTINEVEEKDEPPPPPPKIYSNKRFRNVTVRNLEGNKFLVRGEGQIFEANFSWVVEDGHEELKSGHQMTDAGAPEWGKFQFTVDVEKKRPNSTLHLILFEISAKDGSRQYELPVFLY